MNASTNTVGFSSASEAAETEPRPRLFLEVVPDEGDWNWAEPIEPLFRLIEQALSNHPRVSCLLPAHACVALSSDASVQRLNATYRGKDYATNVLSFPAAPGGAEGASEVRFLGDIVLASETVAREAAEQDISAVHHFQHLVVHGILHLLDFDHEDDGAAAEMEALEAEILASLGIANPYVD